MAFSFFFRDQNTLDQIVRHALPAFAGRRSVRIWDAGCAMGPEPYSLAITFAEHMGHFAFQNLRIDASDIDESNLFESAIARGEYTDEELGRIPAAIMEKYFVATDSPRRFRVSERIRSRVFFRRHDLLTLEPFATDYNLVVCKNVLLHFPPPQRVEVIRMFHRALAAGGFLATEQTQKLPEDVARLFSQVTAEVQLFRKLEVSDDCHPPAAR